MNVWLDLEGTIITNWDDANIDFGAQDVAAFLERNIVTNVSIFSFAIDNEKDKIRFGDSIRPWLERELNVAINSWPSVEDMMVKFKRRTGLQFDLWEFKMFLGKEAGFQHFIRASFDQGEFLLIDDAVENTKLVIEERLTIVTLNVNDLNSTVAEKLGASLQN